MKKLWLTCLFVGLILYAKSQDNSFIVQQKQFGRVRTAFAEKENLIKKNLSDKNLSANNLDILLVAYKTEKRFEIFGKKKSESAYKLIAKYDICRSSGTLGAKRKEGDLQVPEGFYHINNFNPASAYYLSLGVSYPNKSDKIKSPHKKLGGKIYIHGKCVTIGCLPMTDDKIKEIYLYALFAKAGGQSYIPVYIFPFRMTAENLKKHQKDFPQWSDFWQNLKTGYDKFENERKELKISVDKNGNYLF